MWTASRSEKSKFVMEYVDIVRGSLVRQVGTHGTVLHVGPVREVDVREYSSVTSYTVYVFVIFTEEVRDLLEAFHGEQSPYRVVISEFMFSDTPRELGVFDFAFFHFGGMYEQWTKQHFAFVSTFLKARTGVLCMVVLDDPTVHAFQGSKFTVRRIGDVAHVTSQKMNVNFISSVAPDSATMKYRAQPHFSMALPHSRSVLHFPCLRDAMSRVEEEDMPFLHLFRTYVWLKRS